MTMNEWGGLCFGLVVGWITYRTIRRSPTKGISDIASVVAAVGGASVTTLFPADERVFGAYGIGLAVGFGLYLLTAILIAQRTTGLSTVNEWLGDPAVAGGVVAAPPAREEIPDFSR